jgi:hypothetical protein
MTSNIIYHNFQQNTAPAESRIERVMCRLHTALNDACVFLCGACVGFGLLVLCCLLMML